MIIGLFGTDEDQAYGRRLKELLGSHQVKARFTDLEYFAVFANQARQHDLDCAILTCPHAIELVIKSLPEFKVSYMKNGAERRVVQDDYAGSLVVLPGSKLGRERPLEVLILNPLHDLVRKPEGLFLFKRYLSKLLHPEKWFPQTKFTWELANADNVSQLCDQLDTALLLGIDIETDEGSPLRTISCSGYCALFADGSTHTVVIPMREMWGVEAMQRLNANNVPKVMQGGAYDSVYFLRYNAPVHKYIYDTLHMFHSYYSELPKRLDFISAFAVREIRFWKNDGKSGNLVDHYEYNGRDCWATVMSFCSLLLEYPEWAKKNYVLEFPIVFPCLQAEVDGIGVDAAQHKKVTTEVESELEIAMQPLVAWLGPKFNPRSPDQCKRLLQVLGMGKVDSSDEHAMNAAAAVHPFNELVLSQILEARGLLKLISTYLDEEDIWNGRFHSRIDPAGTDTQRTSAKASSYWTGFNIQNIPNEESRIKSYMVVDQGWDGWCEVDKSQSESWCTGYITGCKTLIDVLHSDNDFHSWNASAFFGIPYDELYNNETRKKLNVPVRNLSKRTNHGANYNMGAAVLLETMGPKAVAEAKRLLKLPPRMTLLQVCSYLLQQFDKTYPEIRGDFQDWLAANVGMMKKLTTALGWTRYFFNTQLKASKPAMNSAVAHLPQSLNAGMVNAEFYEIWRASVYGDTNGRVVDLRGKVRVKGMIHDSNLFLYKGEATPKIVQNMMKTTIPVKDIKGVTRMMTIPTEYKTSPLRWSDTK